VLNAQKIHKSIDVTKRNIENSGYTLEKNVANDNFLRYIRYDYYGEAYVTIGIFNSVVTGASFISGNPINAVNRWKEIFKTTSHEDYTETIKKYSPEDNNIIATNTIYYTGKAVYKYKVSTDNKIGSFSFYILD
jgi:hypothetical protein